MITDVSLYIHYIINVVLSIVQFRKNEEAVDQVVNAIPNNSHVLVVAAQRAVRSCPRWAAIENTWIQYKPGMLQHADEFEEERGTSPEDAKVFPK